MSVAINVSEKIYKLLERQAQQREMENVEQFLEKLSEEFETKAAEEREKELARRRELGNEIREFRQKMKEKYGVMPNSVEILREDRMRG